MHNGNSNSALALARKWVTDNQNTVSDLVTTSCIENPSLAVQPADSRLQTGAPTTAIPSQHSPVFSQTTRDYNEKPKSVDKKVTLSENTQGLFPNYQGKDSRNVQAAPVETEMEIDQPKGSAVTSSHSGASGVTQSVQSPSSGGKSEASLMSGLMLNLANIRHKHDNSRTAFFAKTDNSSSEPSPDSGSSSLASPISPVSKWADPTTTKRLGTDRPVSPCNNLYRPTSPASNHDRLGSPASNHDRLGSPAKDHDRSGSPAMGHGRSGSPAMGQGRSGSPAMGHDRSGSPAMDHGRLGSPASNHDRLGSPAMDHGRSGSPAISHGRSRSPAIGHDQPWSPVKIHDTLASPARNRDRSGSPARNHDRSWSPARSNNRPWSPGRKLSDDSILSPTRRLSDDKILSSTRKVSDDRTASPTRDTAQKTILRHTDESVLKHDDQEPKSILKTHPTSSSHDSSMFGATSAPKSILKFKDAGRDSTVTSPTVSETFGSPPRSILKSRCNSEERRSSADSSPPRSILKSKTASSAESLDDTGSPELSMSPPRSILKAKHEEQKISSKTVTRSILKKSLDDLTQDRSEESFSVHKTSTPKSILKKSFEDLASVEPEDPKSILKKSFEESSPEAKDEVSRFVQKEPPRSILKMKRSGLDASSPPGHHKSVSTISMSRAGKLSEAESQNTLAVGSGVVGIGSASSAHSSQSANNHMNAFNVTDSVELSQKKGTPTWQLEMDARRNINNNAALKLAYAQSEAKPKESAFIANVKPGSKQTEVKDQESSSKPEWMLEAEKRQAARGGKYVDPEIAMKATPPVERNEEPMDTGVKIIKANGTRPKTFETKFTEKKEVKITEKWGSPKFDRAGSPGRSIDRWKSKSPVGFHSPESSPELRRPAHRLGSPVLTNRQDSPVLERPTNRFGSPVQTRNACQKIEKSNKEKENGLVKDKQGITSDKPEWMQEAERRQVARNGQYQDPEKVPPQRRRAPDMSGVNSQRELDMVGIVKKQLAKGKSYTSAYMAETGKKPDEDVVPIKSKKKYPAPPPPSVQMRNDRRKVELDSSFHFESSELSPQSPNHIYAGIGSATSPLYRRYDEDNVMDGPDVDLPPGGYQMANRPLPPLPGIGSEETTRRRVSRAQKHQTKCKYKSDVDNLACCVRQPGIMKCAFL